MLQKLARVAATASSGSGEASLAVQLEAASAERDFFRERYALQIDEMEGLRNRLKESQRVIERMRDQILELEGERPREVEDRDPVKQRGSEGDGASSDTSLTSATCCEEDSESSQGGIGDDESSPGADADLDGIEGDAYKPLPSEDDPAVKGGGGDVERPGETDRGPDAKTDDVGAGGSGGSAGDSDVENDYDDIDKIRANAEKMLLWANYQTARASSRVSSSACDEDADLSSFSTPAKRTGSAGGATTCPPGGGAAAGDADTSVIQSLPSSLIKPRNLLTDDSASSPGSNCQSPRSGTNDGAANCRGGGRFGNLLHNLRDILDLDPPTDSENEEEEDDASSGDESNEGA